MSKKNFVSLIFGLVGGVLFALGMCMALLPEWNALPQGVVMGAAGLAVLLAGAIVRRRMAGKPVFVPLSGRAVGATLLGVFGALTLGVGMCLCMVWNHMVAGTAVGLAGIVALVCLVPLLRGIHD